MAKQKEEAAAVQTEEQTQEVSLLDKILTEGKMARDEFQKEQSKDMIAEFVGQVMSEIDRLLSAQLNEIMHHEDFQKLEGSWRGLHYLVKNTLCGPQQKIRVMSVNKKDLLKDFEGRR